MAPKGEQPSPEAPIYYAPLPPSPPPPPLPNLYNHQDQYLVLIPLHYLRRRRPFCHLNRCVFSLSFLLVLSLALFFFWPSDPDLRVVRLRLDHVRIRTQPSISLDISIALTVKVRNRDFFSLDYNSLFVSIGYRGRQLGIVNSSEGHLRARRSSYVEAMLQFDGIEFLQDFFYLLEDLAKGVIPFDTVSEVRGHLGLLIFDVPIKAKVSCEVYVNVDNQTIVRQDCYPE